MINTTTHARVTNDAGRFAWPWNNAALAHSWDLTREPKKTVITYKPNPEYTLTIGRVNIPGFDDDALTITGQAGPRAVKIAALDLDDARYALAECVTSITHA